MNKFQREISLNDITTYSKKQVSTLLYEASTSLTGWEIACTHCVVSDDGGNITTDTIFSLIPVHNSLLYQSNTTTKSIKSITIKANSAQDTITISNYTRKSYQGIPWNSFYGTIHISQQPITLLDNSSVVDRFVLVNTTSLDQYLRGIAESHDHEPREKIKTMTLLAKNYILFYLEPLHRHPSIPVGASYQAIDDPRSFQKYVGAGLDQTLRLRKTALEQTRNEVVTYNNNLAFLPYFSCSNGNTISGIVKYGRGDTPYLQTVRDPAPCADYHGHGVGLAGQGATHLAQHEGKSYRDIISYFYPGTHISTY